MSQRATERVPQPLMRKSATGVSASPVPNALHPMHRLQKMLGNQHVARLASSGEFAARAPAAQSQTTPGPQEIWDLTEPGIIRELLIKLQEIGRAAGTQTQDRINDAFEPYEDSLESDQTFLQLMSIPLGGGGNVPQGEAAGGIAGAVGAAAQVAMTKIMDFKSVGQVKAKSAADIGATVTGLFTSESALYMQFESEALAEMRTEFDTSWANMTPEAKSLPPEMIRRTYTTWYPMVTRQRFGVGSSRAAAALGTARSRVDSGLVAVKAKLEKLKQSQRWKRTGAGALGLATTGALIGGALGAGVFSVPGALIGGAIGGVAGAAAGYFW